MRLRDSARCTSIKGRAGSCFLNSASTQTQQCLPRWQLPWFLFILISPTAWPHTHTTHTPAQTLYGDFNRLIDSSDYLGDAAKYIKLYNKLRDALGTGEGPGADLRRMHCSAHLDGIQGAQCSCCWCPRQLVALRGKGLVV